MCRINICLQLTVSAILSFALTSCMLGPDFHSPASPGVTHYTQRLSTHTASAPGPGGKTQVYVAGQDIPAEWWTLFHSRELNNLIQQGLANSPNFAAAQAALRQTQETLRAQVGSLLYPSVSGQFAGTRQRYSEAAMNLNSSSIFNLYNASINVAYALDVFGAARREFEALSAQVDYEQYQLRAAYLTLTSNIVTSAITVASLQAQIQATHQLIQSQAEQLMIVKKQFNLGGVSGVDVLTQESQLAETTATLPPLRQLLAQEIHALAVLTGEFPSDSHVFKLKLTHLSLPAYLPVSLPSQLVKHRPDIQAAEALLHAASAQVGVATANLYPQVTLNAGYGWENQAPSSLFKSSSLVWSAGAGFLQPILNGGALQAKKRAAVAAYEQADAQYRQTVLQAFQNVADSLRALQHDAEAFRAQKQAEIAAQRSLRITQKQYSEGGVSYLALLTTQRQYQQTRISRIQAEAARYTDTAALFQALGGGWWNIKN